MNITRRTTAASATTATAVALATAGGLLTVVTAPTASAATATCNSPVYKRQFFANMTFSGTPKRTDCDAAIAENWGAKAPAPGLPKDNFGIRWTVTRDFGSGGPFALSAAAQDGIRVYLDGKVKVNVWKNVSSTVKKTVNLTIPSGKHTLRIDYANFTGNANINFAYTPRTSASVDKVRPLVPTAPTVTYDKTTGKAKLTWAKNKEMDLRGYHVYRRLSSAFFGTKPIATTTATSYTDAPPATGETYYYQIRAVDRAGNESAGATSQPMATPDQTGPAAPTGLTAHGDLHGLVLSWNPVTDATRYELYEKDASTAAYTLLKEVTKTSVTHSVLPPETTHTYVVRAYDAAGNAGAYSAPVTSDSIDRTAPAAPVGLHVVPDRGTVTLYWDAPNNPTSDELTNGAHFAVLRSRGTALGTDSVKIACDHGDYSTGGGPDHLSFSCEDPAWEFDTAYTYGVTLTDGKGNVSPVSETVTVTTADRVAPLPVTGLTATPRADGVLLRWDQPSDNDIVNYNAIVGVPRADGTVRWIDNCFDGGIGDPLALLCIGIPDGDTLVFKVTGTDKWSNSLILTDPSVPSVSATELDTRPGEPIDAGNGPLFGGGGWWSQSEDIGSFHWRCEGDVCPGITEYRISRWNSATRTYDPLAVTPAVSGTSMYAYLDETQPLGQVSYYRVVGAFADGTETAATHPYRIRPDLT